jgi:hypothetical protein
VGTPRIYAHDLTQGFFLHLMEPDPAEIYEQTYSLPRSVSQLLACRKRISAHCSRFFASCPWQMK